MTGLQRILKDGLGFALPVEDVVFANCGRLHPMIFGADDRTHCMQFVMLDYTHVQWVCIAIRHTSTTDTENKLN